MDNLIILALFLAGAYLEYRSLMKKREIRELAVSSCVLAAGIVLVLLQQFQLKLPSPMMGINVLFQPIDLFFSKLLK